MYTVTQVTFEKIKDRVSRLNRRAEKLGLSSMNLVVKNTRFQKVSDHEAVELLDIDLEGDVPVIEGWILMAVIQHSPSGNVLRALPGHEGRIPVRYREAGPVCEHCRLDRHRKDTYLVLNVKTGEIRQVGRTCLQDYTRCDSIDDLVRAAEAVFEAMHAIDDLLDYDQWDSSEYYTSLEWYLAWVAAEIRVNGWVSKAVAHEYFKLATANAAAHAMNSPEHTDYEPGDADWSMVHDAIDWIRGIDRSDLSDYMYNLVTVCDRDYISGREFGIAASLIPSYQRATQKPANADSRYIGEIKQRMSFDYLRCEMVRPFEGRYGMTHLIKFTDREGNVFVWWSSTGALDEGVVYTGKGTIKDHSEYRGVKQTVLTRCKLTPKEE